VNSIKLWMTAQNPSCFGMPISGGHAFGAAPTATDVRRTATTTVVRERGTDLAAVKGTKGDMGLAQSYFPGTTAWRPPTC